ncbi:MAG TPA: type II toxin-antitoxin system RelE/ParE family toxin [Caulobacteraceae bacterium]
MGHVTRTPEAKRDAISIWLWVADDNPKAADRLLKRFGDVAALLADNPGMGRAREDLAPGLRTFPVGEYLIFYRAIKGGIDIVRLLHGRRDIGPGLF